MIVILVVLSFLVHSIESLHSAKFPFLVTSYKHIPNTGNSSSSINLKEGRIRAAFFENVLGIRPGQPFEFPLEKWRAIQQSHLFHNITGRTFQDRDGVAMEIVAFENPSLSIKPELSFGLSPSHPDISGGILIRDRNFRGMGERVEVLVSKKEGTEDGVGSLRPLLRFKWNDNTIGKDSAISVTIQREQDIENWANYNPVDIETANNDETFFSRRVPITTKSIMLHTEKYAKNLRYGFETYWKKMKGKWIDLDEVPVMKHRVNTELTGAKFSFNFQEKFGRVSGHADCGSSMGTFRGNFLQWGVHAATNEFILPHISIPWLKDRKESENTNNDKTDANTKAAVVDNRLTATCKFNFVGSDGDGCVPSAHYISGAATQLLRGFPVNSRSVCNRLTHLFSAQIDTFLPPLPIGTFGVFTDLGAVCSIDVEGLHPLITTGVSARISGFKAELSSPIGKHAAARLYLGLDM